MRHPCQNRNSQNDAHRLTRTPEFLQDECQHNLVQLLLFASDEAEANGNLDAALDDQLRALRFSLSSPLGETLDSLQSKSHGAVGTIERLKQLSARLTLPQKRKLLAALAELDAHAPDLADVAHTTRERYYSAAADEWRRRMEFLLLERMHPTFFGPAWAQDALKQRQTVGRLLMCEVALDLYHDEHGQLPETLADLVPEYLAKVPADPFGTAPLKFRTTKRGCLVYSIGPDEVDSGGVSISDVSAEFIIPTPE